MRHLYLLVLMICCAVYGRASERFKTMQCVESLRIPSYPRLIRAPDLTGTATVRFRLTREGGIRDLQISGVHKLVQFSLNSAMNASKFAANCADQEIEIQFTFRLEGERSLDPQTYVVFHPPNRFEIIARPPEMIVD